MRPHRAAEVGLALLAALVGLACSPDDPSASSPPTTSATTPTTRTSATTTTTASTTTASTASTTTTVRKDEAPLTTAEAGALVASIEGPMGSWNPDTSTYDPEAELSAIVGSITLATVSSPQQLFFFHAGRYVATELEPRFGIGITATQGGTVTVRYPHYQPTDPHCCPSLPDYVVRFRWDGTAVQPLDPLPPADQGTLG